MKYLYYLEKPKQKPKKLYLFHIYGTGFTEKWDKEGKNYLFHKRLVKYLGGRIKERCPDTRFEYVDSRSEKFGFEDAKEAYVWFKEKLNEIFSVTD